MKQPLVSINCTTYNHALYIKACLDGFLMQKTSFYYEIVIHDDASTDGTADIIKEYEKKYPDIIFPIYQKENQYSKGIRPTWEFNAPRWRGKYIAACEGDDYWTDPYKLQKQVDFLEANNRFVACFHNTKIYYQDSGKMELNLPKSKKEFDFYSAIQGDFGGSTLSVLFRKEALDIELMNKISKDSYIGDALLFVLLSLKGDAYAFNEYMGVYRQHKGGITKNINHLDYTASRVLLLRYLPLILKDEKKKAFVHEFSVRFYMSKLYFIIKSGNWQFIIPNVKYIIQLTTYRKIFKQFDFNEYFSDKWDYNKELKFKFKYILMGCKNLITQKYKIKQDPGLKKMHEQIYM